MFLCSFTIATADENKPTKIYTLGEVVVSGRQIGKRVNSQVVIDADLIEQKNIQTLDQALELLPGIDVSKGTAGTPRINVRGLRSRHTIILINGIPMNSTWDQQFDPHLIPVENISQIKMSYGTHSVLYGQGGLAGVINIITKQGTTGLNGQATGQIDERGNHTTRASVAGGQDRIDFFAGISQTETKGFLLSKNFTPTADEDGGVRENSDDRKFNIFGNLGFKVNDEFQMGLTLNHGRGEFGVPPGTKDKTFPFGKNPKYERVENYQTFSTQLSADYDPPGLLGFRGWIFANTHEEEYAAFDNGNYNTMKKKNAYRDETKTDIQGGTIQTRLDFDSAGELTVAVSGQNDAYDSDLAIVEKNGGKAVLFNNEYETELYSLALEYKIKPIKKLDLVAGVSQHWFKKENGLDDDDSGYMLGASFKATDNTVLRASYAKKIRFPSIRQLYDSQSGDETLKPETAKTIEFGINQQLPWDVELDAAYFISDVENYIEKIDSTNLFANNEEYDFKGFEIRAAKSILDKGRIALSYSWLNAKDKSPGTQKDELQYRPEHKFVIDVGYTFAFGLRLSADYMYISKQYLYDNNFRKGEISDYQIVNLKIEQKLHKDLLSVFIGADNLFDEDYEESYGFPQPGRTAYAGMTLRF